MNDLDILYTLLNRLRADSSIEPPVREKYEKLVKDFPESGFEQAFPFDTLSEEEEAVIRELRKRKLIETAIQYHGSDGHFYHIDLRGEAFYQCRAVQRQDDTDLEIFSSGAVRDSCGGKSRPDLVSPFALERIGNVLREGAEKYGEHNWAKGFPVSRCMASLHRHLMKYMQGDKTEDHLASLVVNGIFCLHFEEMVKRGWLPESLLDLPDYSVIPRVHNNGDEPYDT